VLACGIRTGCTGTDCYCGIGVVTHRTLIHWFRYAVLGIFILAAVLTPGPDVASQLLLAAPLLFLYGVSIGVAFVFQRRTPGNEDDEDDTAPAATDE
jgi:sec-independent protein translocase protein TatC